MRLEEVQITNFCSCRSVRVLLGDFNPLIGYNNSGKSNVLRAITWLLKKSVLQRQVFWDQTAAIMVEGTISDVNLALLPANQQGQITPYLTNNSLRFRRRQDSPSVPATQVRIEVLNPNTGQWDTNPTGLDNAIGVLFPEPLYIQAMEDAAEDVGKFAAKNTIGLLLKYTLDRIRNSNQQAFATIEGALQQVNGLLNGPARIQELQEFETRATQAINQFFPGLALHMQIDAPEVDELVKGASVALSEGVAARPFTSFGHGAQRSVHMALIKLLATYATVVNGSTVVLLIDEPELYLHPQAIEILRESLKVLSTQGFQVVFSTHSPLMIAEDDVLSATIVYKTAALGTTTRQRLTNAAHILAGHPHQAAVTFAIQHATYVLFSESVVIAEGKTERLLIPGLYKALRGHSMTLDRGCVIEASSSSSLLPMMQVLTAVGFSPKVVADLDFLFKVAPGTAIVDTNSPEYQACLAWFSANTAQGFAIGADGLPTRRDQNGALMPVDPEAAFELLAAGCPAEVASLVASARTHGVWVWHGGAIEAHLGIRKNDTERTAFLLNAQVTNSVAHAADPGTISAFLNWL